MNSPILFKYSVIVEYMGSATYQFKNGDRTKGILEFNFDSGGLKLTISLPEKDLKFTFPTWNSFELQWKVITRR